VALADVREDAVRSAAEELVAAGHKAIAVRCNVADEAEVASMVEQTVSTFGAGCGFQQLPACKLDCMRRERQGTKRCDRHWRQNDGPASEFISVVPRAVSRRGRNPLETATHMVLPQT
jgi:NAD(P)-dependent dehydrogenase (short-subunit alcohol dehydrogenase family)